LTVGERGSYARRARDEERRVLMQTTVRSAPFLGVV